MEKKKKKVFVIIDDSVTWGHEAVWKVFSTIDKAEKFLSQYPNKEIEKICIQEFELDESNTLQ